MLDNVQAPARLTTVVVREMTGTESATENKPPDYS